SPVTACDHAAEAVILEGLARLLPGVCVVSEEAVGRAPPARIPRHFAPVDPPHRTPPLLARRGEVTIHFGPAGGGRPRPRLRSAPRHRCRPGARNPLAWDRGPWRRAAAFVARSPGERGAGAQRDSNPAFATLWSRCGGQPLASRTADPGIPGATADRRLAPVRVGGEILSARRRRRRRLSAPFDHV